MSGILRQHCLAGFFLFIFYFLNILICLHALCSVFENGKKKITDLPFGLTYFFDQFLQEKSCGMTGSASSGIKLLNFVDFSMIYRVDKSLRVFGFQGSLNFKDCR